jgi:hypothetical protein
MSKWAMKLSTTTPRIDWRKDAQLRALVNQPTPVVPEIPATLLADWPAAPARRAASAARSLDD